MISRRTLLRTAPVAAVVPFIPCALGPKVGSAQDLATSAIEEDVVTVDAHSYVSSLHPNAYVIKIYEGEKSATGLRYYKAYYESVFMDDNVPQESVDNFLKFFKKSALKRYENGVETVDASEVADRTIDDMVTIRHTIMYTGPREFGHTWRYVVQDDVNRNERTCSMVRIN